MVMIIECLDWIAISCLSPQLNCLSQSGRRYKQWERPKCPGISKRTIGTVQSVTAVRKDAVEKSYLGLGLHPGLDLGRPFREQ